MLKMHRGRDITVPVHKELHMGEERGGTSRTVGKMEVFPVFFLFLNKKANRFSSGLHYRSAEGNKLQESLTEPLTLSAIFHFDC